MQHRQLTVLAFLTVTPWLAAQAHWTRLYPSVSPSPRVDAEMVFDAARGLGNMFGGTPLGGGIGNEHWQFDGTTWQPAPATALRPPARVQHAMTYDSGREVLVLFGGTGQNAALADTWEWNGTSWSLRATTGPSARPLASMTYDPTRARTVLFGGRGQGTNSFGDTWEWDGSNWQQRTSTHAPSPRHGTAMAYDPTGGCVLLFGGTASNVPVMDDTWQWDGTDWQALQPANLPYARSYHRMVTDLRRGRIVMLGGHTSGGFIDPFAWEWNGTTWTVQFLSSPSPRASHAMAYDADRRAVFVFSGANVSNDTWRYATNQPADYAWLGQGCAGSLGEPALDNVGLSWPWTGDTFTARVTSVQPGTATFFATGLPNAQPLPLDPYGLIGCTLFPASPVAELRVADATGAATWSLTIPNAPAFGGVELAQQVFALDPLTPTGVSLSNARRLVVGIR